MEDKRLKLLSKEDQQKFFDSFDTIFCDVDGVIATGIVNLIEGAADAINALRKLRKRIYFITNNSTSPIETFLERHKSLGMTKEEVVRPANSIIWYLKKQKFEKEIYVIGFETIKKELEDAGFKVVSDKVVPLEETMKGLALLLKNTRPTVGAVVIDFSFNVTLFQLQTALSYVRDHKALFLAGAMDSTVPFGKQSVIGAAWFINIIKEMSGTAPKILSKPGAEFQETLEERLGPLNSERTLFIGDSAETDMSFATKCGMQKLLTLTGLTKAEDLKNWTYDNKFKPDYVVDSIKDISDVIDKLQLIQHKL